MRIPLSRLLRLPGVALGLASALTLSSACHLQLGTGIEARETWTRSYTVKPGATIEVRETNGRIHVEATDGDKVEVVATRIAKASTDEAAKADLKEFTIMETASAERIELENSTRGMTMLAGKSRRIDYDIKVPRTMNVTIKATNGEVDVRGLAGLLEVEASNGAIDGTNLGAGAIVTSTNGRIRLDFATLGDAGVRCRTTNGQIIVTVPKTAKATIAARVTNGLIRTENLSIESGDDSRRRLDATIGGGGPEIRLDATNGEIRVVGK